MSDHVRNGQPVLVLGGTGRTGRRVAERLRAHGVRTRIASRTGEVSFDWDEPRTWPDVLDGAGAAYVTVAPEIALPSSAARVGGFAAVAVEKGVRRLVLLSARGEEGAVASEDALKNSAAEWTILRASHFMQNFSEGIFRDAVKAGELALPTGETPEPLLDLDDLADVAVAVLTRPGHVQATYEVTGSQAFTYADAVGEISRSIGRDIRYTRIPPEAFSAGLAYQGVPDDLRHLLVEIFTTGLGGTTSTPTADVRHVLGREPVGFTDFVRRVAATGVWDV